MGCVLGIDLGTSNTVVAHLEGSVPVVIKNSAGSVTTESMIFCDPPHFAVGDVAVNSLATDPDRVAQFTKRSIGKSTLLRIGGREYSAEFFASIILKKVVRDACDALGEEADGVVITVPAYFGEAQRQATFAAARLAGLKVLRLINEPTAAALAYGITHRDEPGYVLVYDLGGGTFDVTILEITSDALAVIAIGGDPNLGGKDLDDALMRKLKREIKERVEGEPLWDAASEADLWQRTEALKKQLSSRSSATFAYKVCVQTEDGERGVPVRFEMTREKFEQIIAPLLVRTEIILTQVIAQSGLHPDKIRHILCVGGSSRIPLVRDMLERLFGRRPLLHEPDECVAKGAAIQAAMLGENATAEIKKTRVSHVLPRSLGVAAVRDGKAIVDQVLPGLTPLPCMQVRHGYTTSVDYQNAVQVPIYEGDSSDIGSYGSGPIGSLRLEINPPRRRGQPNISVRFQCDENGLIIAEARDLDTGRESRTTIVMGDPRHDVLLAGEAMLLSQSVIS